MGSGLVAFADPVEARTLAASGGAIVDVSALVAARRGKETP